MKLALLVFCAFLVSKASGLSCLPCNRKLCKPITCPGPKVMENCGCCLTCAKLAGETCGGEFNLQGTCAPGHACLAPEKRILPGGLIEEFFANAFSPGTCYKKYTSCAEACGDDSDPPSRSFLSWGKSVHLAPKFAKKGFWAYCDCAPGNNNAWMLVQRRASGMIDFDVSWKEYENGFGVSGNDYWLGLEAMHQITKTANHELMITVQYEDSVTTYTTFGSFRVGPRSSSYKLSIGDGQGEGSSEFIKTHNGMEFSAKNRDNDRWLVGNCAETLKGGWWHSRCTKQNLNGPMYGVDPPFIVDPFPADPMETIVDRITWSRCTDKIIKLVEIKMRPVKVDSEY